MPTSSNIESIKERLEKLNGSTFTSSIKMKFVNMTDHIVEMALAMISTMVAMKFDPSNTRRRITLFADQMFGSGKSRLGIEFIAQVKEHLEEIKGEVKNIVSNDEEHEYAVNVLNCLVDSVTIRIEFKEFTLLRTSYLDFITNELQKRQNVKSFLIHIDEINCYSEEQVRAIWNLLTGIQFQLQKDNNPVFLHLYFSGKQTLFNVIVTGSSSSPSSVKWVILHPLQENYVKEIVQDIVSQNKLSVSDIDYFSKQLHYYIAGVPRMIEFVLLILTKTNAKLETQEEVDEVLDEICFDYIKTYAPDSQKFQIASHLLENVAVQFLLASQMEMKLKFKDVLQIYDPDTDKIIEDIVQNWLVRLPLYLNGTMKKEEIEVLTKGYVYRLLKPALEKYTAFRYLEKFDTTNASIMKKDVAYEVLITHQFLTIAYYLKKWPRFLEKNQS